MKLWASVHHSPSVTQLGVLVFLVLGQNVDMRGLRLPFSAHAIVRPAPPSTLRHAVGSDQDRYAFKSARFNEKYSSSHLPISIGDSFPLTWMQCIPQPQWWYLQSFQPRVRTRRHYLAHESNDIMQFVVRWCNFLWVRMRVSRLHPSTSQYGRILFKPRPWWKRSNGE